MNAGSYMQSKKLKNQKKLKNLTRKKKKKKRQKKRKLSFNTIYVHIFFYQVLLYI